MKMNENVDEPDVYVPEAVLMEAREAVGRVVPVKSKTLYEKEYKLFCEWRDKKKARGVDENIILAYMLERSDKVKSSSMWSYYSQLKKMLSVKENVDISRFHQVTAFLKQQSTGYTPKKSQVFTREDLEKFLDTAPDDAFLLLKVVFIIGIAGGCRIGELVSMSIDDVDDRGNVLVIQIPDTKTYKKRTFTVVDGSNSVHAINVYQKYRKLRPDKISHKRLFLNYKNKKCTVQPVGINTFSKMPQKIASFLGFANTEAYTGHCFRRSSATLLANTGADLTVLKRHGGWRSSSVAEGYIEDSIANKIDISKRILGEEDVNIKCGVSGVTKTITSLCTTSKEIITSTEENCNSNLTVNAEKLPGPLGAGGPFHFSGLTSCNFFFNGCNSNPL